MCNPTTRSTSIILQLATNAISRSYALAVFYNIRHPNNTKSCWWLLEVFLITHTCSFCCVPLCYLCLFHYWNHLVPVSIDWLRQLQPRCIPWSRSTMCKGMQICRTRFAMHLCWTQSSNCNAMKILTIRSTNCSAMQICRTVPTNCNAMQISMSLPPRCFPSKSLKKTYCWCAHNNHKELRR